MSTFRRATKEQSKLRLALAGPAGSGKTYSALMIGGHIAAAEGKQVALIDTERGSASKYSDLVPFHVCELESFHPQTYIDAIHDAEEAGYGVLIVDSLSHAWMGKDGALALVDQSAKRSQSGNSFGAWRDVTPLHNALVDAMIGSRLHLIATLRSKQEYVQEKDRNGHTVIRKIGLAPVQRDGIEYEFDVYGELTSDNDLIIGKTRCPVLSGGLFSKPGKDVADILHAWVTGGEIPTPRPAQPTPNGKAKKAPTREQMCDRLAELWNEADALGVPKSKLPDRWGDDTPEEELIAKGKKIKALIDAAKNETVAV